MSLIPARLRRHPRVALGTTTAVVVLAGAALVGTQVLTDGSEASAAGKGAACHRGQEVKRPDALVSALKAANKMAPGPKRSEAKATIRKDLLAGKYGKELQARAQKAQAKHQATVPAELRAARARVQDLPEGEARKKAAKQLRVDVLAGKYGAEVQKTAAARKADRVELAKARKAATTPALQAARAKVAAIEDATARKAAAKALTTEVRAGKYGEAAKAFADKQAAERAQARKEMKEKVEERREQRREACQKKD